MTLRCLSALVLTIVVSDPVIAAEKQKVTYDARGRVIKVERTGTINNGVTSEYQYDKVTNRTRYKVTGSSN